MADQLKDVSIKAQAGVTRMREAVQSLVGTGNSFLILSLFGIVLIAFMVAIMLYYMISYSIASSKTYILPPSKMPMLCSQQTIVGGDKIPKVANGKRMSITFWIFINDLNVNTGMIRRVFSRGSTPSVETSSPFIAINDKLNKLHVAFSTTDTSQYMLGGDNKGSTAVAAGVTPAQRMAFLSSVHGITIDYIPMQRWVHVGIVVNEESSGGIIMAYIDGELVQTVTSSTKLPNVMLGSTTIQNVKLEMANFDFSNKGDVIVGGENTSDTPGFAGLVSQIGFTNTDLNADDIYRMYIQGPINNILTKMGLSAYGVQSPIYRIG